MKAHTTVWTRSALQPTPERFGPHTASIDVRDRPLRVCIISYRSNPHSGGQGVYIRHLSKALDQLGHRVEVISGPPDLDLASGVSVVRLPTLDLYDPKDPFRIPSIRELIDPVNLLEWIGVSTMGFPEPMTFGIRAWHFLRNRLHRYDILHDNQSLSYGIWAIRNRIPTLATVHHPITVDRDVAVRAARGGWQKMKEMRWHSFVGMQRRVARSLRRIITVSRAAGRDLSRDFGVDPRNVSVVPNGIDTEVFRPLPGVSRLPHRVIVTTSADTALKGLPYLLLAVRGIARRRPIDLVVVGEPAKNGRIRRIISELRITDRVHFTGRIDSGEFVRQYARAAVAAVPSVYEGFGLPAGEAMACSVPVVSTTGGALPEVVGDAGILVPTASSRALERAIEDLLDHPERARALGQAGYRRVHERFTWRRAGEQTVAVYRELIRDHRRL
ncbi:MAG: glycosyltransferase family 4 protein [Desulfobacteraceae bacterium]|nr:glycosyltransferase family 4 protein [Desulfobacteraceae bacterium]